MIFDTLQNVNGGKPAPMGQGGGGMSAISGILGRQQQGQRPPFAPFMDWMRQRGQQQPNTGIVPPHMQGGMGGMGGGGMEGMGGMQAPGGFAIQNFQPPQQMQPFQQPFQNPMRWG